MNVKLRDLFTAFEEKEVLVKVIWKSILHRRHHPPHIVDVVITAGVRPIVVHTKGSFYGPKVFVDAIDEREHITSASYVRRTILSGYYLEIISEIPEA